MPRIRPATDPISFHKPTGQYYVTRGGKRIYLGADRSAAVERYHRLNLPDPEPERPIAPPPLTVKELANRFIATQRANWQNPQVTLRCYREWVGRFLEDHPRLLASELTVEMFAAWKLGLRARGYAAETINHYLNTVRAMFAFAEQTGSFSIGLPCQSGSRTNDGHPMVGPGRPLYTPSEVQSLLRTADPQMRAMILLALNCGFGPKDLRDLTWGHFEGDRVTLPRSKTGICQDVPVMGGHRQRFGARQVGPCRPRPPEQPSGGKVRSDGGHTFITYFWRPWSKDAVAEQFRKLCKETGIRCHGF